jgi:hypothetical protein
MRYRTALRSFAKENTEHKKVPLKKSKHYFLRLNIDENDSMRDKIEFLNSN